MPGGEIPEERNFDMLLRARQQRLLVWGVAKRGSGERRSDERLPWADPGARARSTKNWEPERNVHASIVAWPSMGRVN